MDLTDEKRAYIDRMGYAALLWGWRHHKIGDPMFQGETGRYWHRNMVAFENQYPHVADLVDKNLGCEEWWSKGNGD